MLTVGTIVRTREQRRDGHTRLPRYLARARGVIVAVLGSFPLPDDVVVDAQQARKSRLYTVAFRSPAVFEDSDAATICADLFEEYLEVES